MVVWVCCVVPRRCWGFLFFYFFKIFLCGGGVRVGVRVQVVFVGVIRKWL